MTTHELKTWPACWKAMNEGLKTFEARKNDRDYQVGDRLVLCEWDPTAEVFTGRTHTWGVQYILVGPAFGIQEGHCVMSLVSLNTGEELYAHSELERLREENAELRRLVAYYR